MTKVDEQLEAFLKWNEEDRREGFTIANVMAAQHEFARSLRGLSGRVAEHDAEFVSVHERLDHHGAAIVAIKRRVRNGVDDEEMDTGQFDLIAIRRKVEEQEQRRRESERVKAEDTVWWKRTIILWVVGALGVVATSLFTVVVTLAIAGASRTAQPTTVGAPK